MRLVNGSEAHLTATAAASGDDTRDVQDEVGIDYEVPQNIGKRKNMKNTHTCNTQY